MNTWPNGVRRALGQSDHNEWNDSNYPGTRQLCSKCDEPTGRCEDDSMNDVNGRVYCKECYEAVKFGLTEWDHKRRVVYFDNDTYVTDDFGNLVTVTIRSMCQMLMSIGD